MGWNIALSSVRSEPGGSALGLDEGRPLRLQIEEVQHVVGVRVAVGEGRQVPLGLDQLQDRRVVEDLV
jgi:hypothetical protein